MDDITPEVLKAVPGVAGSLVSLLFIKDTWPRRIALFAAGAALSYFGTPWLRKLIDVDAGFAGFVLGLLGMVIVAKGLAALEALDAGSILRDFVRKILGLPPAPPTA